MRKTNQTHWILPLLLLSGFSIPSTAQQLRPARDKTADTVLPIRSKPAQESVNESRNIFVKTEVEARVDQAEWRRHLEQHLVPIIQNAAAAVSSPESTRLWSGLL